MKIITFKIYGTVITVQTVLDDKLTLRMLRRHITLKWTKT